VQKPKAAFHEISANSATHEGSSLADSEITPPPVPVSPGVLGMWDTQDTFITNPPQNAGNLNSADNDAS